ncbi:MAG TPA: ABC transporter ATP-binding protein [Opitutaceae bacterium]|nr:ABC transporter ATP-binding protein [Opitutaceae bacterium]
MTEAGAEWALELTGVSKEFPVGARALDGISLRLARGRLAALVGPNGSGKTTVLKLLAGLIRPTSGTVRVGGHAAGSVPARAGLGYLPETPDYPGWLTGRELLRHLGRLSGLDGAGLDEAIARRAAWAGLRAVLDRPAQTYSSGQRQRLGLAQALLHDPALVLLDEPAAALDPGGIAGLADLLRRLRAERRTVVLSSHFLPQVEATCDHAWLLRAGRLIWEGDPTGAVALSQRFIELAPEDVAAG